MKLTAVYEPAAEGGYVCWLEEMPSVQTQGETLEEARINLQDAFQLSLACLRDRSRAAASAGAVREPMFYSGARGYFREILVQARGEAQSAFSFRLLGWRRMAVPQYMQRNQPKMSRCSAVLATKPRPGMWWALRFLWQFFEW